MNLKKLVLEQDVCSVPWLHTSISQHVNKIRPCCKYDYTTSQTSEIGKLNNTFTIEWHNSNYKKLRQDWIINKHVPECNACSINDSFSYKKTKNNQFLTLGVLDNVDIENPDVPVSFEISLKNTCNLACRMCIPTYSSKLNQLGKKSETLQKYIQVLDHTLDNKFDLDKLKGMFKNAILINFMGGEPLIDEDLIDLVKLIKSESNTLRGIFIPTNMTMLNHNLLTELNNLNNCRVILNVSLDGPKHIHEYIRFGCNYDDIVSNLKTIHQQYTNIEISFSSTISILNVGYIHETISSLQDLENKVGFKALQIYCNPVLNHPHLHPSILPDDVKEFYLSKLSSVNNTYTLKDSAMAINTARSLLNDAPKCDINKFIEFTKEFDKLTNMNVFDVYPEFSSIFNEPNK